MTIDPALFNYLLILMGILGATVIVVVISYLPLLRMVQASKQSDRDERERRDRETAEIIAKANAQAEEIIANARRQSGEILSQSQTISADSRKMLEDKYAEIMREMSTEIQNTTQQFLKQYGSELGAGKDEAINAIQNVSKAVEGATKESMEKLAQSLEQETVIASKSLEEKVSSQWQTVEKELEDYRAAKIKKIDESIYIILKDISENVLGKAVSLSDQKEMISRALDDMKKEHAIGS